MKNILNEKLLEDYFSILSQNISVGKDRVNIKKFSAIKKEEFQLIKRKISNCTYKFTNLRDVKLYSNRVVYIPTIRDRIVLEYVKDRLQQKYHVSFRNRDEIIKTLTLKFRDNMDFFIVRLDIKQFFNSIPYHILLSRIKEKSLLSSKEYYLLKEIFKVNLKGIPQGLAISNILAEIYMENFDNEIKNIHPRLNYYCRYVDDIIIIINGSLTPSAEATLKDQISELFKKYHLKINDTDNKYKFTRFPLVKSDPNEIFFSYLGYKFCLKSKKLTISIDEMKIKKYKNKINYCFNQFKENRNLELLIQRLDFLTKKNAVIKTDKFLDSNTKLNTRKKKICFGIIENYKYIDIGSCSEICKYIDYYILNKINSIKGILNSKKGAFNRKDKKRLYSISLTGNKDSYNAIYKYKKETYIQKLIAINPLLSRNDLDKLTYKELSKTYFTVLNINS